MRIQPSWHGRPCQVSTIITLTSLTLQRIHNEHKPCPGLLVKETQKNDGYFSAGRCNSLLRNIPGRPLCPARFVTRCDRTLRGHISPVSGMHRRSSVRTGAICRIHQGASVLPLYLSPSLSGMPLVSAINSLTERSAWWPSRFIESSLASHRSAKEDYDMREKRSHATAATGTRLRYLRSFPSVLTLRSTAVGWSENGLPPRSSISVDGGLPSPSRSQ